MLTKEGEVIQYLLGHEIARKILNYLKQRKTATTYQIAVAIGQTAKDIQAELDTLTEYGVIKSEEDLELETVSYLITASGHQLATKIWQEYTKS